MGQFVQQVPIKFKSVTVTTSGSVYLDVQGYPFPLSVTAVPGASGSIAVAYSCTPDAAGKTTTATWINWPSGTVTSNTTDVLIAPVAGLRFIAATSTGTVEINA